MRKITNGSLSAFSGFGTVSVIPARNQNAPIRFQDESLVTAGRRGVPHQGRADRDQVSLICNCLSDLLSKSQVVARPNCKVRLERYFCKLS